MICELTESVYVRKVVHPGRSHVFRASGPLVVVGIVVEELAFDD